MVVSPSSKKRKRQLFCGFGSAEQLTQLSRVTWCLHSWARSQENSGDWTSTSVWTGVSDSNGATTSRFAAYHPYGFSPSRLIVPWSRSAGKFLLNSSIATGGFGQLMGMRLHCQWTTLENGITSHYAKISQDCGRSEAVEDASCDPAGKRYQMSLCGVRLTPASIFQKADACCTFHQQRRQTTC